MSPTTKELSKRLLPSLLLLMTSGCDHQSIVPIKLIHNHNPSKHKQLPPEYVYLDISTPESLVNAMKIGGENVLLKLTNSDILNIDTQTKLTDRQVITIIENMRDLTAVSSTSNLGFYRLSLEHYLTNEADPESLKVFVAASDHLITTILSHWDDINWFEDTSCRNNSNGDFNQVSASSKQQSLENFINTIFLYKKPLSQRPELSFISLKLIPGDESKEECYVETDFNKFINNFESLQYQFMLHITNGDSSA